MQFAPPLDRLERNDYYHAYLLEKQDTGIWTLMSCNFAMIGLHIVGVLTGNVFSYVIAAAGVSFVYGWIADILTWDYNTDLNRHRLAESSWYLQIANFVLTIVSGLLSILPAFINTNFIVLILSSSAAAVGVIGGITGAIYDIATLELWNYFEFDIVDPYFVDPYIYSSGSVTETEIVMDPLAAEIWKIIADNVKIEACLHDDCDF